MGTALFSPQCLECCLVYYTMKHYRDESAWYVVGLGGDISSDLRLFMSMDLIMDLFMMQMGSYNEPQNRDS